MKVHDFIEKLFRGKNGAFGYFRWAMVFILTIAVMAVPFPKSFADQTSFQSDGDCVKILQEEELHALVLGYLEENDLREDLVSIAYLYPATGESWYFHADTAYYSASLYKVPLMMLVAEKVSSGELDQDSEILGMPLSYIEEEVLSWSNNPIAYSMMLWLGDPPEVRRMFQRYSNLPEDYYNWEFYSYSYFTARFMSDVMITLYQESDRFPNVIDCLKQAQPDHYFRLHDPDCEVAQKYGMYHDDADGADWNHAAGIFYTDQPFILTVMTRYGGISEFILSDLADRFLLYSREADQRYADWEAAQEESCQSLPGKGSDEAEPQPDEAAFVSEMQTEHAATTEEWTEAERKTESEERNRGVLLGILGGFAAVLTCAAAFRKRGS